MPPDGLDTSERYFEQYLEKPETPPPTPEEGAAPQGRPETLEDLTIVPLSAFVDVEEEGASALVGTPDAALIPEGGDVMFYGDGGAGKTSLAIDLACHLAAGDAWLGMPVARPVRVLLVENEGPRPLFRAKLRRKLAGWQGSDVGDRVHRPRGRRGQGSPSPIPAMRRRSPRRSRELEIDVLIAGPVTHVGHERGRHVAGSPRLHASRRRSAPPRRPRR